MRTLSLSAVPLAFLVLLLILALLLERRTAYVASESRHLAQVIFQSDQVVGLVDKAGRSVLAYDRTRNEKDLALYRRVVVTLPRSLATLRAMAGNAPGDRAAALRLSRDLTLGLGVVAEYLRYARLQDTSAKQALVNSPQVRRLSTEISLAQADFNERARLTAAARLRKPTRQIAGFTIALIVLCVIGIGVTIVLSLRFGLRLTRRIERLAENARRLAVGADAAPIGGQDEITELDRVYREMMHRTQREHDTVMTLQHALLPQTLPSVRGVRLDAAYVPAYGGAEIGGDWYDVFPITERLLGISVGDVAGHGLHAAATMGQTRQGLRTASYITQEPGTILEYANRLICRAEREVMVTAFFATLDLADGRMRYAVAGHPPPMFVRTGGTVESLPGRGFILGVDPHATFHTEEAKVDIGSAVVFFTDGLIEAERDYLTGIERLRDAIEDEYRNASGNIAQAIVRRLFAHRRPRDDVALLFLGITTLGASTVQPQRMTWNLDATLERSARRVKRAILWHLGESGGGRIDLPAAELVVNELLGNVARHSPGPAELMLEWRNDGALVVVRDRGRPFEPPAPAAIIDLFAESGRGLFLVRSVAKELTVEWTGGGNRVSAVLPLNGALTEGAMALQAAQ